MINKVTVIGAGTMGNGIAHLFSQYGFTVTLVDTNDGQLARALPNISANLDRQISKGTLNAAEKQTIVSRIATTTRLAEGAADADLIIEAATENETLKKKIFQDLDRYAPKRCILASNTSSISIAGLAAVTARAGNVIGMHFMNPVPVMKLVEVINGKQTLPEVTETIVALSKQMDKLPCVVNDYPGFIANRILMPMINEAVNALQEGVAGVVEIDTIMKLGMSHPMGPLQLADFIGLDVCVAILNVLHEGLKKPHYQASSLLIDLVKNGKLGKKSGEGFYIYEVGSKDLNVSPYFLKFSGSN
jgi:3-hydroxybutyryl-CoA dehydrogenase